MNAPGGRCLFFIATAIVACFMFTGCGGSGGSPAGKNTSALITADIPMTGNLSYYGTVVTQGLSMAVDDYNGARKPGEPSVMLKLEDNFGNTQEAVKVFNKAVDQDGAVAVVSLFTPQSVALLPLSTERKVIIYATVTSVVDFGSKYPFGFRDYISLPAQSQNMARYLFNTAKVTRVASLVVNDDYGLDAMRLCKEEFERLGGKWITAEAFEQKDLDIRDPVTKVVGANPEAIFMCGREQSLANAVRQTREQGFKGLIVSNNGFDTPNVFKAVGEAGEGVVFTSAAFDVQSPASTAQADFVRRYTAKFKQSPDYNAAHGYTVGQAICSAIRAGNKDTEKIRAFLQQYSVVDILGEGKMTEKRDVERSVAIYRFHGGAREKVSTS